MLSAMIVTSKSVSPSLYPFTETNISVAPSGTSTSHFSLVPLAQGRQV